MKKLLVFSILFLTCSLGLKSVKADTSLDNYNFYNNSWLVSYNIFDTEFYNYGNYNGSNIHYKTYTEDYIDNYNSLVNFFKENDYYYIFGNDKVAFWQAEGLEPITYAYSDDEGAWLSSTLYNPNKDIVYYAYYSSELNSSNILNKKYGSRDIFCADGNSIFRIKSGTNSSYASYTTRYSISDYSVVLDTNVGIRFDTDYFLSKKNYSSMTDDVRTYYHSITVNNKTYNSGDYIYRGGSKVGNPKISLKYLTTTGDDTGSKIGATVSIDFNTFDKSRYSYLISFDNGNSWDGLTPRMTSSTYTFSKLENFNVIAQLYDTETDKSYYSTLLVDKIDTSYHSKWLTFERDDTNDEYTVVDGQNYLVSTTIYIYQNFNKLNGYPLQLYYSYDSKSWISLPKNDSLPLVFDKNATLYFMYRDVANQVVFRSTHTFDYFNNTQSLGETISFDEEEKVDGKYRVIVFFLNYKDSHSYWVKSVTTDYQEIDVVQRKGMYSWLTKEETTFCAKITEKGQPTKIIQEECYLSGGVRITPDKSFNKILSKYGESIPNILNVMSTFFISLPGGIQDMFIAILLITLAIFIIKLLL